MKLYNKTPLELALEEENKQLKIENRLLRKRLEGVSPDPLYSRPEVVHSFPVNGGFPCADKYLIVARSGGAYHHTECAYTFINEVTIEGKQWNHNYYVAEAALKEGLVETDMAFNILAEMHAQLIQRMSRDIRDKREEAG